MSLGAERLWMYANALAGIVACVGLWANPADMDWYVIGALNFGVAGMLFIDRKRHKARRSK